MKKLFLIVGLMNFFVLMCHAQIISSPTPRTLKVAVLAPMYLDSTFSSGSNDDNSIPRYVMPGLEFIQGAEIAFDTLSAEGFKVEAHLIDSKSSFYSISWMIKYGRLDNMNLLIGSVKEPEYSQLATFAAQKKIPFISVTYPNSGGIRKDSFLTIVNSTLKAHCEGIYSYLVQKHGLDNIYLVKRKNENRIEDYFKEINQTEPKQLLRFKTISFDEINADDLRRQIDTTKPVVLIGASLNETFALMLADAAYAIQKNNKLSLIGMPNWDGFRDLYKKSRYTDFPIRFTTPHWDDNNNEFSSFLGNEYFTKYRAKPGDMAYKGFEAAYYFTNILLHYPDNFIDHLNEDQFAAFHTFNFRPVYLSNPTYPDYFENKHLFIMQILNGQLVREN